LEKTSNYYTAHDNTYKTCKIEKNITTSISLGEKNIVPNSIKLFSGGTLNEKKKTLTIGGSTKNISINYETGIIKIADGSYFSTSNAELKFNFKYSQKIVSDTLSFS
jgi:hypothetical protein